MGKALKSIRCNITHSLLVIYIYLEVISYMWNIYVRRSNRFIILRFLIFIMVGFIFYIKLTQFLLKYDFSSFYVFLSKSRGYKNVT